MSYPYYNPYYGQPSRVSCLSATSVPRQHPETLCDIGKEKLSLASQVKSIFRKKPAASVADPANPTPVYAPYPSAYSSSTWSYPSYSQSVSTLPQFTTPVPASATTTATSNVITANTASTATLPTATYPSAIAYSSGVGYPNVIPYPGTPISPQHTMRAIYPGYSSVPGYSYGQLESCGYYCRAPWPQRNYWQPYSAMAPIPVPLSTTPAVVTPAEPSKTNNSEDKTEAANPEVKP